MARRKASEKSKPHKPGSVEWCSVCKAQRKHAAALEREVVEAAMFWTTGEPRYLPATQQNTRLAKACAALRKSREAKP